MPASTSARPSATGGAPSLHAPDSSRSEPCVRRRSSDPGNAFELPALRTSVRQHLSRRLDAAPHDPSHQARDAGNRARRDCPPLPTRGKAGDESRRPELDEPAGNPRDTCSGRAPARARVGTEHPECHPDEIEAGVEDRHQRRAQCEIRHRCSPTPSLEAPPHDRYLRGDVHENHASDEVTKCRTGERPEEHDRADGVLDLEGAIGRVPGADREVAAEPRGRFVVATRAQDLPPHDEREDSMQGE